MGRASGEGQGSFCPFISRDYQAGTVLYECGEKAAYVWFVKSGEVEVDSRTPAGGSARKTSGDFVGLESLVRPRYAGTARIAQDATLCGASRAGFAQWLGPHSERTCTVLDSLLTVRPTDPDESGESS